jgi:hypothetical protein
VIVSFEFNLMMKELGKAMKFIWSVEFWRMAVFWTVSLLISYWHLWFSPKSNSFPRCAPATAPPINPVCIITGVQYLINLLVASFPIKFIHFLIKLMQATSGLGAAAAYALSKEGFCVVLGIPIPFSALYFKSKISFLLNSFCVCSWTLLPFVIKGITCVYDYFFVKTYLLHFLIFSLTDRLWER